MKNIELSIIVPVYNTEKYLKKCLNSIITSLSDLMEKSEIIIVNDGSNGSPEPIIEEYKKLYNEHIIYVKQKNKGLGGARNTGLSNARGKFISFIDSDDYVDANFYHEMLDKIKKEKSDICICDFETIDKEKSYRVEAKNLNIHDDKWGCFDIPIMPSSCNKIIKKELFSKVKYSEKVRYEDLEITPIMMLKAKKVSYLPKMYYKYFLSNDSIMRQNFDVKVFTMFDRFESLYQNINNLEIPKEDKERALYMIYTRRFYEDLLQQIIYIKDKKRKKEICKEFCKKAKNINRKILKNKYFKNEIFTRQRKIKKIGSKLLHFVINNNLYSILYLLLSQRLYFKYFSIVYKGISEEINGK